MEGHWRKIVNAKYLAGDELVDKEGKPKEFWLTIKSIEVEQVVDPLNGQKKPQGVLRFNEIQKGMILNITNGKTISMVIGSPMQQHWIGKKILVYGKEDKRHGRVVRIKLEKPKA